MDMVLQELQEDLALVLADQAFDIEVANREVTVKVEPRWIVAVMTSLRDHASLKFKCFIDICGVDWPGREKRFDVVYHLLSLVHNRRVRVKIQVTEEEAVPSITGVFSGALWFEREAYDMYGIRFTDHPDLRRLLTDYGFEGFPLRKNFPLTGYTEVRYDEDLKRVVKEPVKLVQAFRDFDFESPWEGAQSLLPGDEKVEKFDE